MSQFQFKDKIKITDKVKINLSSEDWNLLAPSSKEAKGLANYLNVNISRIINLGGSTAEIFEFMANVASSGSASGLGVFDTEPRMVAMKIYTHIKYNEATLLANREAIVLRKEVNAKNGSSKENIVAL